jgi:TetR/AcrR family transcriptional repressor of nem operon
MPRSGGGTSDTAERALDVAERLAQTRGFNGFSYKDVAAEVGITTASLHYHFPTKTDLGQALVIRYTDAFQAALAEVRASDDNALTKLERYIHIYREVLGADRMCLCGMFAAEYATLPPPMQEALRRFFDENERWLVDVLDEGLGDGSIRFDGDPKHVAGLLTGALEGSMLLARSYGDENRFGSSAQQLLKTLRPPLES